MEITIGNQGEPPSGRVIDSGSVVVLGDAEVRCRVAPRINVYFAFTNDNQPSPHWTFELLNSETLRFTLVNFGSPTNNAGSNSVPVRIGTLQGRDLFVNFSCQCIGDVTRHARVFSYTFFIREEERQPNMQPAIHS